jgi:hypothetical protein
MSERTRDTDRDTMARGAHPIDDDDVARLVREVAGGWSMPPVRLDQPGWRERIRSPQGRRAASLKGWFGRLGQAAAAGVVLTVVAALVAVYLTGPTSQFGKPSSPPSTPGSTPAANATALPQLLVHGDLPSPSRVLVQTEGGQFAVADLATGKLGSLISAGTWNSRIVRSPSGDLVCLCTSGSGTTYGQPTHAKVSLNRFDDAGNVTSRIVVLDIEGVPDPRYGEVPQQPGHVSTWASVSADGRFAYIGWAARAHPVWKSGIVVVSLDDGTVLQRLDLPDKTDGTMDLGVYVDAPRVAGQSGSGGLVIARSGYRWGPVLSSNASYLPGADVFMSSVDGDGRLGQPAPVDAATDCGDEVGFAGPLPGGGTWLSCRHLGGAVRTTILRLKGDGSQGGQTSINSSFAEGSTSVVSPDGASLYIWDASGLELNRVELATGNVSKAKAPAVAAASDPLLAFGRWLAPPTLAKMFLQPGIAISPDGSRVYGLGIVGSPSARDFSGSAGVVVFDTESMTSLGRWEPTADFVSVAVSPDGKFVYATGSSDVDAAGNETGQPASITVFNAADGTIRLIAGSLGRGMLSLADPDLH